MFLPYTSRASVRIVAWIESMVSIDRFICVVFPFKYKVISNKKFASRMIMALIIFQLSLNAPNLFFRIKTTFVMNPIQNHTQILQVCTGSKELSLVRDLLDELVRSIVPLII